MADSNLHRPNASISQDYRGMPAVNPAASYQPTVSNGQYMPQMQNPQYLKQAQEPPRNSVGAPNTGPPDYSWLSQQPNASSAHGQPPPNFYQPAADKRFAGPNPPEISSAIMNGPGNLTNGVQPRAAMAPQMNRLAYRPPPVQQFTSMAPPQTSDMMRPQTLHLPRHQGPPQPNIQGSGVSTPNPVASEPPSAKSSRNPSPIPSQRYDAMEGQFSSYNTAPGNPGVGQYKYNPSLTSPPTSQWPTQPPPGPNVPQMQRMNTPPVNYQQSAPIGYDGVYQQPLPNYQLDHAQVGQQQQMPINPSLQKMPIQSYPNMTSGNQVMAPHSAATTRGPAEQWSNQHVPNQSLSAPLPNAHRLGHQLSNLSFQTTEVIDLMQTRNILPSTPIEPPKVILPSYDSKPNNCNPDIFRCTLTKIPETQSILHKSRLPLGILIHPFKDLTQLPVVQCNVIVRCRSCRTYINPFVHFLDQRRWKCNLCYRVNELQEEFQYDPITKSYGDPTRRPEIRSATIEFIAPSEYMLRPPQPAVYLFVLDVSYGAVETGYLRSFCDVLLENLEKLPGDSRTQIGFITFNSSIHFYNLGEGLSQPQMMIVSDIQEIFLPCPDNLLVNLHENIELVKDLLQQLPLQFTDSQCSDNALGAALEAGFKLVSATGGRIMVLQASLPNIGPGALKSREDPNIRAGKEVPNLGPANDYYKKLSLSCSSQQVAVDLFILSSQYCDIATLSCISKYSGGSTYYYPGLHVQLNPKLTEKFEMDFKRYLTRKIGLEAVMRIRCTKGLSIHTFHGNFFVRSTDLLSLPNINPDAGFAMQMSIEESLTDCDSACFQAALLYTSCKGERRIRVHTLCLPVTASVSEVIYSADQQAIVGLLTKMAVDRSLSSSMSDARDALINAVVDAIAAFKVVNGGSQSGLLVPPNLKLLPLYILAILKHICFRFGTSTKLDERVFAMNQMKTLPLSFLMPYIYPVMYPVHKLDDKMCIIHKDISVPQPPILALSSEKFERQGAFLLDNGERMFLYICQGISQRFCQNVFNVSGFDAIPDNMIELPELETPESERLRVFINHLYSFRPFQPTFTVLKSDSKSKHEFIQLLVEDRSESSYSYFEFLKHLQQLMTK